jgi:hypothetical protein
MFMGSLQLFAFFSAFLRVRSHMNDKLRSLIELLVDGFPEVEYPLRPPPSPLPDINDSDASPSSPGSTSSDSSDSSRLPSLVLRPPPVIGTTPLYPEGPFFTSTEASIYSCLFKMHRIQKKRRRDGCVSRDEIQ